MFVPPRFDVYRAVSRQIHAIFADYTPLIEPLSLDEAYLDVTEDLRGLAAYEVAVTLSAGARIAPPVTGRTLLPPAVTGQGEAARQRSRGALDDLFAIIEHSNDIQLGMTSS